MMIILMKSGEEAASDKFVSLGERDFSAQTNRKPVKVRHCVSATVLSTKGQMPLEESGKAPK